MASTFKNGLSINIGTTPVDIYTTPGSTATTVIGLSIANVLGSACTVTVTVTKGGTTANVVKVAQVPVGGALVLFGGEQKLVLMAADKITVTANTASSVDAIISYLEIT